MCELTPIYHRDSRAGAQSEGIRIAKEELLRNWYDTYPRLPLLHQPLNIKIYR